MKKVLAKITITLVLVLLCVCNVFTVPAASAFSAIEMNISLSPVIVNRSMGSLPAAADPVLPASPPTRSRSTAGPSFPERSIKRTIPTEPPPLPARRTTANTTINSRMSAGTGV